MPRKIICGLCFLLLCAVAGPVSAVVSPTPPPLPPPTTNVVREEKLPGEAGQSVADLPAHWDCANPDGYANVHIVVYEGETALDCPDTACEADAHYAVYGTTMSDHRPSVASDLSLAAILKSVEDIEDAKEAKAALEEKLRPTKPTVCTADGGRCSWETAGSVFTHILYPETKECGKSTVRIYRCDKCDRERYGGEGFTRHKAYPI